MAKNLEMNKLTQLVDNCNNSEEDNLKQLETCIKGYNDLTEASSQDVNRWRLALAEKLTFLAKLELDNETLSSTFEEIKLEMNKLNETLKELTSACDSFESSINEEVQYDSKIKNNLNAKLDISETKLKSLSSENSLLQEHLNSLKEANVQRIEDHVTAIKDKQNELKSAENTALKLIEELDEKTKIKEKLSECLIEIKGNLLKTKEEKAITDAQLANKESELTKKKNLLSEKRELNEKIVSMKLRISNLNQTISKQSDEISCLEATKFEIINAASVLNKIPCEKMGQQNQLAAMKANLNDSLKMYNDHMNDLQKLKVTCEDKRSIMKKIEHEADVNNVSVDVSAATQKLNDNKHLIAEKKKQIQEEERTNDLKVIELENKKCSVTKSLDELVHENEAYCKMQDEELYAKKEAYNKLTAQYKSSKASYQHLYAQCRILKNAIEDAHMSLKEKKNKPTVVQTRLAPPETPMNNSEVSSSQDTYCGQPVAKYNNDM